MSKKQIALERMALLFEQAEKNEKYAGRYVALALKIAQKARTRIPKNLKRKFCSHCKSYFHRGNYRVRTIKNKLVYTCFNCRHFTRIPLAKQKQPSRKT